MKEFYGVAEVAEKLGLTEEQIRRNIKAGKIKAVRAPGFRNWRIPAKELERLLKGQP